MIPARRTTVPSAARSSTVASRPVLNASICPFDDEPSRGELVEQFGVEEVHLSEIGLRRILRHAGTMLNGDAEVRVVAHSMARHELDGGDAALRKGVPSASVCRENGGVDGAVHQSLSRRDMNTLLPFSVYEPNGPHSRKPTLR